MSAGFGYAAACELSPYQPPTHEPLFSFALMKQAERPRKMLSQAVGTGLNRAGLWRCWTCPTVQAAPAGMAMNRASATAAACRGSAEAVANHGWRADLIR